MAQQASSMQELLAFDLPPQPRSHQTRDDVAAATLISSAAPRRRATPKATRADADAQTKRKRHADAERERIHRKQSELARMREVVDQLERHLHSLSTSLSTNNQQQQDAASNASLWYTELDDKVLTDDLSEAEKRELYIRALTQSGWLRREKASLQSKLNDYGLLEAAIESLLKDLIDATIHEPTPSPRHVAPDAHVRKISYRDLLSDECYELIRDLISESNHFKIQPDADTDTETSRGSLDWTAICLHDDRDVRFSLTKRFPDADLYELASSVWLSFHDPSVSNKIFASTLRLEVLQRINDDVLVVRWQIDCGRVLPYVGRCRNLVFRWKTHDGFFVGCRTIDELEPSHPAESQSNPTNGAFDQFYWAKFTHDPSGQGCRVTFAGRVGVGNGTSTFARFLSTEIPILIFRWESMVVGPLFNFSSSDAVDV